MNEEWKDVVGFEDYYQVSNLARVYSKRSGRVLKQTVCNGYAVINTRIGGRAGTAYSLRVHRMVAEAFLLPPSAELVEVCSQEHHGKVIVRHLDNNKMNNLPSNLAWGTMQDNADDWKQSENFPAECEHREGFSNPGAVLTEDSLTYIKSVYVPRHREFGARALGRKFGIAHTVIVRLMSGKTYATV